MSEEATPTEMSPEIVSARDALVTAETQQGNGDWAKEFSSQQFSSMEEMYQAYAQRGEAAPKETVEDPPSEEPLLAGKFKSQEDLEKAYVELQKKLGAPPKESTETPKAPEGDLEIKAQEVTEQAGLDINELQQHYQQNGSLSEDQYAALSKAGFDKSQVESFISEVAEARAFKAEQASQTVFESVGGKETYDSMVQWAQTNLSDGEQQAYNKAVNSGDLGLINLAVQGLQSKYTKANGSGSTDGFVSGAAKASTGVRGYEHHDQMIKDMNSEEFRTSPSFQAKVRARLAKTTAF